MTVEELNSLVENAYAAAFEYEKRLADIYSSALVRAGKHAASEFRTGAVTAAGFVPPPTDTLTTGLTETEQAKADATRNHAAQAIALALAAVGLTAVAASFMQAISDRGALNFDQEVLRVLRSTVDQGVREGWTADETAEAIQRAFRGVSPVTAQMLAQTELTSLVNERSLQAAQKVAGEHADPLYKQWQTMKDPRVRVAHASAQGQTVPVSQPFDVGGYLMMYPGDPSAPMRLVARCRCRMTYTSSLIAAADPFVEAMVAALCEKIEEPLPSTSTTPPIYVASAKEDTIMPMTNVYTGTSTGGIEFLNTTGTSFPLTSSVTIVIDDAEETEMACPDCGAMNDSGAVVCDQCGATMAAAETDAEAPTPMADGPAWRGLLAVEGVETDDGRMLAEGSLTWRDLPLSLTAMDTSQHGAEGEALVCGRIDRIWRDGNEVWGEGVFNTDEFGTHIYELVSNQSLRGNSIEPAVTAYEIRNRDTGEVLEGEAIYDAMLNDVPLLTVFLEAVIMCSTIVPTPALADANIVLASGVLHTNWFQAQDPQLDVITAAAAGLAPLAPPAEWFADPRFTGPTPLTVTPEGRVMGHAALWNSCHIGEPSGPGICVPPPRSGMNYEIFHHGVVTTAEGIDVPCGQITMSTLHAGRDLSWAAALEHYEHSGCAAADVVAGEDRHGIWVSGGLRPNLSAEKVRELKGGSLSGDWRSVIGRGLEFLGALVVNIGGFPIPRPEARIVASATGEEEVLALVAAGMVTDEDVEGMTRREYLRKIEMLTEADAA